jgi:hypothetical protein
MVKIDKRTINDFLFGAGVGAIFDLLSPNVLDATVKNTLMEGLYVGVPTYALRAMSGFSPQDCVKAGGATYLGSVVGQTMVQVGKYLMNTV